MKRQDGFTFIEIMVVVIILGILAAVILPKFAGRTEEARVNAATSQIDIFATALDAYELDNGRYPTSDQGLNALVKEPSSAPVPRSWRGPYLAKKIKDDPWGSKYIYIQPGKQNKRSYDIASYGPDAKEGGEDDINNWE